MMTNGPVDILDSAFVAYSRSLPLEERVEHFADCFISSGELYFELGSKLGTFDPRKLAERLEALPPPNVTTVYRDENE